MSEIKVESFGNRSGDDTQPYGFIDFTDGNRIAYGPTARDEDTDFWGLTLYHGLTDDYVNAARVWLSDNRMPTSVDFHPVSA